MFAQAVLFFSGIVSIILFLFVFMVFLITVLSLLKKKPPTERFEPRISVVIPCYNEEKNIGRCLDSVINSGYNSKKMEIIVVDDGSTDKSAQIVSSLKKKFQIIKIIKGKHEGKSGALNSGVIAAHSEIIVTLDADTFVGKGSLSKLVQPFLSEKVGASNGSCKAANQDSLLALFQDVEYSYNDLVRKSFSDFFGTGIWFFGAFACYRKSALKKVGFFKKASGTEDMHTYLELYSAGHNIVNVYDAYGFTVVPKNLEGFVNQRVRWWSGVLASLFAKRKLWSTKSNPSVLFLFINQFWWSIYAIIGLPLLAFQFIYWSVTNVGSVWQFCFYLFNWFSLFGSFYLIYKIGEWGLSLSSVFGVATGILGAILILTSFAVFKQRFTLKRLFGVFFYFPYTILLNIIILLSLFGLVFFGNKYFKD